MSSVIGRDVHDDHIRNEAAAGIAAALGRRWSLGADHGPGLGTAIDHEDGRALRITLARRSSTPYLTIRGVMPAGAQGLEPPSITARADRGERIALDVRRKLLPAYGAALEAARSHLADIDRLKAQREEAAGRLVAALPASRCSEDQRDDSVTVRSHLRLPASTPEGATNARVVARVGADGTTADIRADRLPVDIAAEIMRIIGRSAAARPCGVRSAAP